MDSIVFSEANTEPKQHYGVTFKGQVDEYFKIWIVNLALMILTLGIYSAWAKVRSRRYFYGNTYIAGSSFDYHGDPIKILKGRLLVGGLFLVYSFGGYLSPVLSFVAIGIFWLAFPWIFVKGMLFNLSNTSYRNVRFAFANCYKLSYETFFKSFAVVLVTLGLGVPYYLHQFQDFKINNSRFGQTPFRFFSKMGPFFTFWYAALGLYLITVFVGVAFAVLFRDYKSLATVLAVASIYSGLLLMFAWFRAREAVIVARSTKLGEIEFESKIDPVELFAIYITNLLACAATLGLAFPWAMIRLARYRASRTNVISAPSHVESFLASSSLEVQAGADAAADFWDIDVGF
jgi:uncharacterized membrane protein YjgN (DUF898 family)